MSAENQRFDTFNQWVTWASNWLTSHPDYSDDHRREFRAICFDAHGRLCTCGRDFMRARDQDAFPVRWLWPDQIACYGYIIHANLWPAQSE